MSLAPNTVEMTIAQIMNATTVPGTSPSVTHNGLPFGDYAILPAPVAISGTVTGFGDFSGLVLAYFGLDSTTGDWKTGTAWVVAVTTTSTYSGTLPAAADQFTAVVMEAAYWQNFLAANPANGGVITVAAPPSPGTDGDQVRLATLFSPGQGRTIYIGIDSRPTSQQYPAAYNQTLAPGGVLPQDSNPPKLIVQKNDQIASYTVNGAPVAPTDALFIQGLLNGMPYVPPVHMQPQPQPTPGALAVASIQGGSPQPGVTGGSLYIMLYQSSGNDIYLLIAGAGPNGAFFTDSVPIYQSQPLQNAQFELVSLVNVFSDQVTFNVVSVSEQISPSVLGNFLMDVAKTAKFTAQLMFTVFL